MDIKALKKKIPGMTAEEKSELLRQIELKEAELKELDPFWFYEPSDGSLSDEGGRLLRRWLRDEDVPIKLHGQVDLHLSKANILGASGGNQSGKSAFSCIETLIKVTRAIPNVMNPETKYCKWPYPKEKLSQKSEVHYRVVAEDRINGLEKNVIPTYQKWVPREYLGGGWDRAYSAQKGILSLFHPQSKRLLGTIEFMSNQQEVASFQGPARDGIVYDEEPRYDIYRENLMRMTTAEKTDILFAMTPTRGLTWVHDEVFSKRESSIGKVEWYKLSSVTNKKANLAVLNDLLAGLSNYDEIKMRLLGEFISLSGLVYGRQFDEHVHVIDPFETGCNCGMRAHSSSCPFTQYLGFLGVDPHMVKPSTAAMCFVDREENFFVDRCLSVDGDTEKLKEEIRRMISGKRIDWAVFDPSSDSSITAFRGRNIFQECTRGTGRIPVRSFKGDKYQGSIAAGVDAIKRKLKLNQLGRPNFYIFDRPENQGLIKSFKTMERDTHHNEEIKGLKDKIREGVHDHHACVRYIFQNRLSWKPHVYVTPEPVFEDKEAMVM